MKRVAPWICTNSGGALVIHRLGRHIATNLVAYVALVVAIAGSGGSYAVAATARHSSTKPRPTTLVAGVGDRTGAMSLERTKRCSRGHYRVSWAIKGPRGATGPAGAPAPSVYAAVDATLAANNIQPPAESGMAVVRSTVGAYLVTITSPICAKGQNVPVVTPTSDYLSGEATPPANATPVAFIPNNVGISTHFTIDTGYTANGSFTPEDLDFDVQDTCHPASTDKAQR